MNYESWQFARLGDLVSIKHGWPFKSQDMAKYLPGRPIVVGIGNFEYTGGFRFGSTTIKVYTGDYPKEFILKPDDVLLVMTCQTPGGEILGIPGRIPNDDRIYLHNQRMGKVVIKDRKRVDIKFLYWLFLHVDFNRHLAATATGTKILHTAPERIESFRFLLPPLNVQRTIGSILSAYDDLIENNTRRITILEEMAQKIYEEWFVKFRFPGHEQVEMVESEMGRIPERWEVALFAKIAKLSRQGISPEAFKDEIVTHYSIPAYDEGRMPTIELGENIKSNKYLVPSESVLLSKLNPRFPRVWLPTECQTKFAVASTEFIVLLPNDTYTKEFIFSVCCSSEFRDRFTTLTGGTSTSHQRVKPDDFLHMNIVVPGAKQLKKFTEIARPILKNIESLLFKNTNLRLTRDLLLPKLISGEIDVSSWTEGDAQEIAQELAASAVGTINGYEPRIDTIRRVAEVGSIEPMEKDSLEWHSLWE